MGILSFATTWVNLEGIVLSETRRHRRSNTAASHLYEEFTIIERTEAEPDVVVHSCNPSDSGG